MVFLTTADDNEKRRKQGGLFVEEDFNNRPVIEQVTSLTRV